MSIPSTPAPLALALAAFLTLTFALPVVRDGVTSPPSGSIAPPERAAVERPLGWSQADTVPPGLHLQRPVAQFARESWSERDGLPQNFVNSLAQTEDGYLWLGSERGLIRWDGVQFSIFTPETHPGLPLAWIRALAPATGGGLWVGTGGGGVAYLKRGRIERWDEDSGLGSGMIRALQDDGAGGVWVGTEREGLYHVSRAEEVVFPGEEGESEPVGTDADPSTRGSPSVRSIPIEGGGESPTILSLASDRDGTLWVGMERGLGLLAPGDSLIRPVSGAAGLPATPIMALESRTGGGVWVGTGGRGLWWLGTDPDVPAQPVAAPGSTALIALSGREDPLVAAATLASSLVNALVQDPQGALWVATNGDGLFRWVESDVFDGAAPGPRPVEGGRLEHLDSSRGLPSDLLWALQSDREGHLWIGSNIAGLIQLRDGPFETIGGPEGLSMDVALATMMDSRGALWVGTPGGGVNRLVDGGIRTFRMEDGLGSDIVLSVAEDAEGDVWVGTGAGGVSRIRGETVTAFGPDEGVPSQQVSVVHRGPDGSLWMGAAGVGLLRWEEGPGVLYTPDDGLPGAVLTSAANHPDGSLWVGTREGLARIGTPGAPPDEADIRSWGQPEGLPNPWVTSIHVDEAEVVWVATLGGLAAWDGSRMLDISEHADLPMTEPMGVISDGTGSLWVTSSQGVTRIDRRALLARLRGEDVATAVRRFGRADGLRSAEANGGVHPTIWRSEDGAIWFPTMAGVVRIDPDAPERRMPPVVPVIHSVRAGGHEVLETGPLVLAPDRRSLDIAFSAPTFADPHEVRYRYRLEPLDTDWVLPGDRRGAVYTQLPPRSYTFHVEAAQGDGPWHSAPPLSLELEPRVHERLGVQLAGGLLLFILLGGAYRTRIRRMQEREDRLVQLVDDLRRAEKALLEREEALRQAQKMEAVGRLAGGVAHDFNNILSVISSNAELALMDLDPDHPVREELEEVARASERAATLTQQLLAFGRRQVLQPEELDLNRVVQGVDRMMGRVIPENIGIELELESPLPPVWADEGRMEQVLVNLMLNARDAMPEGGTLTLSTRSSPGIAQSDDEVTSAPHVILEVRDSGHGMAPETLERIFEPFFTTKGPEGKGTGLGLASVYGIVQQSGARVEAKSEPGRGSIFRVRFPVFTGSPPPPPDPGE